MNILIVLIFKKQLKYFFSDSLINLYLIKKYNLQRISFMIRFKWRHEYEENL